MVYFPKPIPLTNPHTNLDISQYNLYNIYFKLLDTGFNIPLFINAFFNAIWILLFLHLNIILC